MEGNLVNWNDIHGPMTGPNINYKPEKWKLYRLIKLKWSSCSAL